MTIKVNALSMKTFRLLTLGTSFIILFSSCSVLSSVFKRKSGCPTDGKNIGAERLISGDPAAEKAARKAKKFKS